MSDMATPTLDAGQPHAGTWMLPVDNAILNLARERPGIAQAEIVRDLIRSWSAVHIRSRVATLGARGALRVEHDGGGRLLLYPVAAEAIAERAGQTGGRPMPTATHGAPTLEELLGETGMLKNRVATAAADCDQDSLDYQVLMSIRLRLKMSIDDLKDLIGDEA